MRVTLRLIKKREFHLRERFELELSNSCQRGVVTVTSIVQQIIPRKPQFIVFKGITDLIG